MSEAFFELGLIAGAIAGVVAGVVCKNIKTAKQRSVPKRSSSGSSWLESSFVS
jgi:hypothetical protein